MSLPRFALGHRTIVMAFTAIVVATGLINFGQMSRREDPEITIRDCLVITAWPGTPAAKVQDLITDPLEKALTQIPEVDRIRS